MLVKTLTVGHLGTNCYVVTNEKTLECVVIDPGDESNTILDYIEDNSLKCVAILLTHGHFDHVGAVQTIADETGAIVHMNKLDDCRIIQYDAFPYALPQNGMYYVGGEILQIAGMDFEIIATPGHTPGSVTIRCEDALFTGDTLFKGSCGRTDLFGGNQVEIMRSLKALCSLEGDYDVYPGHMEQSTLYKEKLLNYYCRQA